MDLLKKRHRGRNRRSTGSGYPQMIMKEETLMKKQYEQPMAEKIEFNYKETIVASGGFDNAKKGKNNPGCYKANMNGERNCAQY